MRLLKKLWGEKEFRRLVWIAITTRILIFLIAYMGIITLPGGPVFHENLSDNEFINAWGQYDGAAYLDIATHGYNQKWMNGYGNYNWFPFYAILINIGSYILSPALSGFLISNFAFIGWIILLYILIKDEFEKGIAYKTVLYMLIFPTSYFFNAVYTESVFLLMMVAAFYLGNKKKWWLAGVMGLGMTLTRPQGVLIVLPLAYQYLEQKKIIKQYRIKWRQLKKIKTDVLSLLLAPLGLITFMIYELIQFNNPLKFLEIELFNRHIAFPFTGFIVELYKLLFIQLPLDLKGYITFNLLVITLFIILTVIAIRRLHPKYQLLLITNILVPLSSNRLEAETRYFLILFPAFILIGILEKEKQWVKKLVRIAILVSVLLLCVFTVWHTRGGIAFAKLF